MNWIEYWLSWLLSGLMNWRCVFRLHNLTQWAIINSQKKSLYCWSVVFSAATWGITSWMMIVDFKKKMKIEIMNSHPERSSTWLTFRFVWCCLDVESVLSWLFKVKSSLNEKYDSLFHVSHFQRLYLLFRLRIDHRAP
jgi:hypothetical protein